MKYIDADKLKAEIERLKSKYRHNGLWLSSTQSLLAGAKIEAMNELLLSLDTLEEEPVPKGYDEAYLNEKIAKASKTWEGVDVDKYIDEVRGREPDKGLDVTDFCKPIDPGIAQCLADHWLELLGDKEPNKSLEESETFGAKISQ